MKLKLTLARMASPAFIGGFRTLRKSRFGRAEAWAIYRTGEQIDRELERFFAIRKEIEDRFAQSDGKSRFVPKDTVPAFQQELEELGQKEIELWLEHKVTLPEDCLIEPDELGALVEAGIMEAPDASNPESAAEPLASAAPASGDAKPRREKTQPQT